MTTGRQRTLIPSGFADLSQWPAPDEETLNWETLDAYVSRKRAVQMYADGIPVEKITAATSIPRQKIFYLVSRCVTPTPNGSIAGFLALLPGKRLRGYTRHEPVIRTAGSGSGGCAGALTQLFSRFPEVEQHVRNRFLGTTRGSVKVVRISYTELHGEFLDQLRDLAFTDDDWPFNTKGCGYKSIRRYCLDLLEEQATRWFGARAGQEAVRRHGVGSGYQSVFPRLRGYGACQLDFHKVDAASVMILETEDGARLPVPVARWHIGFLVEERWGLVLGAFVALESTPSGDSVLEVVESALCPMASESDGAYCQLTIDGKVLPLQLMPELAFNGFSVLKMDNAWSNSATEVVDNIIRTVGCAVNFGPVKAWWRRPLVERIFGKLSERGLKRLPSTLGSGPKDTRRDQPVEKAMKFEITIRDLIDVIHACIREHNEQTNEGITFATPLGALKHSLEKLDSGFFLQPLPRAAQQDLKLLAHLEIVTVRGNREKNIRPYVTLGRWRYTNPTLASSYGLIGRQLAVYCNRRDVQVAHATVLDTGEQLGALLAPAGKQGLHISWRNRTLMNQAGLSQRLRENTTSVPTRWCEVQEEKLRERSKGARKRKRTSKEALVLSKFQADQKRMQGQMAKDGVAGAVPPPTRPKGRSFFDFESPSNGPTYLGD
jgi:putative transposase